MTALSYMGIIICLYSFSLFLSVAFRTSQATHALTATHV